jgi:hypothetical protein
VTASSAKNLRIRFGNANGKNESSEKKVIKKCECTGVLKKSHFTSSLVCVKTRARELRSQNENSKEDKRTKEHFLSPPVVAVEMEDSEFEEVLFEGRT